MKNKAIPPASLQKARRHLARRDPVLRKLIAKIGPCTLQHNPNRFEVLARSIISQQISSRAAISIGERLVQALTPHGLTPAGILTVPPEALRQAGLSASKARSLTDLSNHVHRGLVPLDELHRLEDEDVIARLVPVYGIGRWTAEMFLIFSLGRLDVLPVADHGLRVGVQQHYGLKESPDRAELEKVAEPWRPYRTIATWYFWRTFGPVPQSESS